MREKRLHPRMRGYLHAVLLCGQQRLNAHVLDISRTGALVSLDRELPRLSTIVLMIDVDKKFEVEFGAPDVLRLEGVVIRSNFDEGPHSGEHNAIQFTPETVNQYWRYIDMLPQVYNLKSDSGSVRGRAPLPWE